MNQSRNLLLAFCILFVAHSSLAQSPPTSAPAASAVTIPQYSDTPRGLEKLLSDMMKLTKDGDNQALAAYVNSLTLPNPDDWFSSVFGDDGPRHAAASAPLRSGAGTTFPSTLATMLKENRTTIEARKFEKSCDKYATEKEYPLLLQRHSPVPLYDARFSKTPPRNPSGHILRMLTEAFATSEIFRSTRHPCRRSPSRHRARSLRRTNRNQEFAWAATCKPRSSFTRRHPNTGKRRRMRTSRGR